MTAVCIALMVMCLARQFRKVLVVLIQNRKYLVKEITRINHLGLRVKDLNTSRAFYEKLGFIFIAGPVGPEPVAIMEHPSGININFILNADAECKENILMDSPKKNTGYTHVALEVTSAETALNSIRELGITITVLNSFS